MVVVWAPIVRGCTYCEALHATISAVISQRPLTLLTFNVAHFQRVPELRVYGPS